MTQSTVPRWRNTPPLWRHAEALLFAGVFVYTTWGLAAGLVLYALRDTIVFFYTPSEISEKNVQPAKAGRQKIVGEIWWCKKSDGPERHETKPHNRHHTDRKHSTCDDASSIKQ